MDKNVREKTELRAFIENSLVECFYRIFRVDVNTGEFEVYKDNGLFNDNELRDIPDIYAYMQKLNRKLSDIGTVQFTYQKTDDICMNLRILEVDRKQEAKPETIRIFAEEGT